MNKNYLVVQCFGVNVAFIDVMVLSIKKKIDKQLQLFSVVA